MSGTQPNRRIMSSKAKNLEGMPSMPEILELVKILRKNGDKVLTGASKLLLSTKLLHNLNDAFTIIIDDTQDLENSFQVCSSSKIDLFRDLKFLHDFVQKTVWLKVAQGVGDPRSSLDISKFRHLRFLELQKVCIDLVTGIQGVRGQLESISCTGGGGVGSVGRLLASCGGDAGFSFVWASLKRLALPYNGLGRLDKSLELAPWLQTLDLSHNLLVNVGELGSLENLKNVNLGYNKLEAAPRFSKANYHFLQVLVLKNNYIENLNGLEGLDYLIELDLSYNCLTEHSVLWPLESMVALSWILLEGNPLSYHEEHRFLTIKHLHWLLSEKKFVLDRQPLDKNEKALVSLNHLSMLRTTYLKSKDDMDSLSDSVSAITSTSVENSYLNDLMASQSSEFMDSTGRNLTRTRRKKQIREAVIDDNTMEIDTASSVVSTSCLEMSTEHLETKKQMLALREKFGNDKWLVSHAGSYVQGIMGLEKSPDPVFTSGSNNNFAEVPKSRADSANVKNLTGLVNLTLNSGLTGDYIRAPNPPTALPSVTNVEELHNPIMNSGSSGDYADVSNSSTVSDESNDELSKKNARTEEKCTEKECGIGTIDRNENESDKTAEGIAGPNMTSKIVEAPYDPEEETGEVFLVQKKSSQDEMDELFLIITPEHVTERDGITGIVRFKWSTNTVLSCVMGRGQEPSVELIFDTTRNDRMNRTYYVEQEEAVKIVKMLSELIKARPIVLKVFKCMKCSTHFSQDPDDLIGITKISISEIQSPKCPSCRSTLVIETDELQTLDAQDVKKITESVAVKSYADENQSATRDKSPENNVDEGNLQHSESHSSIGGIEGGPKPITTSLVHFDSRPPAQISCSATSLDESRESTPSASTIAKRYESDIEVLSNPSQSSIEVLDDGSKASSTPSRKRSSEERRIAIAPTLLTIPDTAPAMAGLTESSSSGSLTDSICTTYENKVSRDSGSDGKRHTRKNNESEALANLGFTKETATTPVGNLTSMLGGLLQSMKIGTNKGSLPKSEEGSEFIGSDIRYSYTDFSSVDHRIKLHLILNVFEQESEELVMLLRAEIVMQSLEEPFQGCLVLSTSKIYVLRITGNEGEDPQRWLHKEASWTMDRLRTFAPLPFKQGVLVEVQLPNKSAEESANARILCILQDFQRTSNLLFYLADLPLPPSCELDFTIPEQYTSTLQSLMLSSEHHRDGDTIRILALFSSATLKHKTWEFNLGEMDKFKFGALIVTSSAVLLTEGKIQWLLPGSKDKPFTRMDQPLSNLIEVIHDNCSLGLRFSDEVADIQELWTLMFVSTVAAEAVIKAIQPPWEELFSVPLQITSKMSEDKL